MWPVGFKRLKYFGEKDYNSLFYSKMMSDYDSLVF
jgi:hypothetical protein